jgi:hypothetical protein
MLMSMPYWNNQLFDDLGLNENNITVLQDDLFKFLKSYGPCFSAIQFKYFCMYTKGLLSDLKRKSMVQIALRLGNENPDGDAASIKKAMESAVDGLQNFRQEGGANLARKASPSQILTTQNYYLFVFGSVGLVWPGQEKGAEQAPPVDFIGWKKAGSPIGA